MREMLGASRWLDPDAAKGSRPAIAAATRLCFVNDMNVPLGERSNDAGDYVQHADWMRTCRNWKLYFSFVHPVPPAMRRGKIRPHARATDHPETRLPFAPRRQH